MVALHFLQRIFANRSWTFSSAIEYLAPQEGQESFTSTFESARRARRGKWVSFHVDSLRSSEPIDPLAASIYHAAHPRDEWSRQKSERCPHAPTCAEPAPGTDIQTLLIIPGMLDDNKGQPRRLEPGRACVLGSGFGFVAGFAHPLRPSGRRLAGRCALSPRSSPRIHPLATALPDDCRLRRQARARSSKFHPNRAGRRSRVVEVPIGVRALRGFSRQTLAGHGRTARRAEPTRNRFAPEGEHA